MLNLSIFTAQSIFFLRLSKLPDNTCCLARCTCLPAAMVCTVHTYQCGSTTLVSLGPSLA